VKTEELLRYDRMYATMRQALDTPWLVFDFPEAEAPRGGRGLGPGETVGSEYQLTSQEDRRPGIARLLE
jgi:hypothetical protein